MSVFGKWKSASVGCLLVSALLGGGCDASVIMIDARRDSGMVAMDAQQGMLDASEDAGMDAGPCEPVPLPSWSAANTMGPMGESMRECIERVGATTDERLPVDQFYELTTFGGPGDEQDVACSGASRADGSWYYAANGQRFSCGARIRIVDQVRRRCVIVEVADIGPNICVEEAAERPIWDVSPLAAEHLFGASSVGWSEHRGVYGARVDPENPLGPCDDVLASPRDFLRGFVGGACDSAGDCVYERSRCLTDEAGFPGGMCSRDCDTSCPDRTGASAYTACVPQEDGSRLCMARCDFSLFEAGCRAGYECQQRPHPSGGDPRWVCVPECS